MYYQSKAVTMMPPHSCLLKHISDFSSFLFLFSAVIAMYLFELFVVIHEIHQDKLWIIYMHAIVGSFVFINILGNLFKIMFTDSSTSGIILPSLLKPLWRFCSSCEANAPPRTFHCSKCNVCVLKRDHHCVFAGCCIGLRNFRYYLVFLFYMSLGALYASVLNMCFVWSALGGFSVFSVAAHFVPFVFWLFGWLNISGAFYALMSMLGISGFMFVVNLFYLHLRQMLYNQTTYERNHNIVDYDLGWKQNLTESLGNRWYFVWLFPTVVSGLPSDGLTYTLREDYLTSAPKIK